MTEEKKHKKRKFLFNPLKRPLPYVGLIIAFALIIFQQTIRNYVSDTIGDMLVNSMKEATDGVYKTTYDLVRFDIISKELRISNLKIELDTTVISKEDYLLTRPNLINVNTPIIVVKLRSILPLLLDKQLFISFIGAKEPKFKLVKSLHSTVKKEDVEINQQDFRAVFNTYFTALEIDSFRVERGAFDISTHSDMDNNLSVIHIGEFTTMLKGFKLDSLSPSILLKGIRARSFELEVMDQDIKLPSINQSIHFNRLLLSTTDSTFILDSLEIKNIAKKPSNNELNLSIKRLEILGFNFEKAFTNNDLFINEIQISEPKISFKQVEKSVSEKTNNAEKSTFYDYFQQLKIKNIKLFDGSINYEGKRNTKIENFSISVSDYSISPEDWDRRKAVSGFSLKLLHASGIEQELPDSIHIANIEDVIYTRKNNKLLLKQLAIKPILGRNRYTTLQKKKLNFSTNSSIKAITLTSFAAEELVINNRLEVDSVIINKPVGSVVQYPAMRISKSKKLSSNNQLEFNVNHFITNNGSLILKSYKNKVRQTTRLNGIYITSANISHKVLDKQLPARYKFLIKQGSAELKNIGHSFTFNNLSFNETQTVFIKQAMLAPDSTTLPYSHFNAKLENIVIEGIDINAIKNKALIIDSISIGNLISTNIISKNKPVQAKSSKNNSIQKVAIGSFSVSKSTININQFNTIIHLGNAGISLKNFKIDSLQNNTKPIINFDSTLLAIDYLSFEKSNSQIKVNVKDGYYDEARSRFMAGGLSYTDKEKSLLFNMDNIEVTGFDKQRLLEDNELIIKKLKLTNPYLSLKTKENKNSITTGIDIHQVILKGGLNKINLDSLQIIGAKTSLLLPSNKHIGFNSFKGIATNYSIDTTTTIFDAVNDFKGTFEFGDIYLNGLNDTLSITKLHLNTYQRFIWTDSLFFNSIMKKNNLSISSPGVAIDYIDIPKLLKSKIDISRISSRNNIIHLMQTDTAKNTTKTRIPAIQLPLGLSIENINLVNTKFTYAKLNQPKHLLSYLNFDIKLDSLEASKGEHFNITKNTSDSRLMVYNFSFDLPDSLNTIGFDTLSVSSKKSQIDIANFNLTARFPKYKYGNQVGYQVDWKDLLFNKIKLENIDFVELIENKTFQCQKITLNSGHLKLFKDKQLPFPSNRVIPILQERIKGLKMPLKIDSIEIKNFDIYQSTLQSTGLQEGGITFLNTYGLITNITNDSLRLLNNKMLKVTANTKIMGSGNLYADFDFDMLDENNLFFFDARLGKMDAKAFNNILEATAFVKVKSGEVKSLNLHATGNKKYAYGDMSFIYSNLKIETINKKTLETKGMGKVLKTFFANAFVVKKNNSRIKFISRRGGMYYERDISRITLDYMAKTALSGVVSSIGAKSNQKQIKQITKDNKAARDLELKQQKELDKAAKKKAKKEQ